MGLMLGLNILDVLVFSGSVLKLIAKKIRKGLKSSFWSRLARRRGSESNRQRSESIRQVNSEDGEDDSRPRTILKRPKRWMRHKKLPSVRDEPDLFSDCASGCRSRCADGSPRVNNSKRPSKCFKKKKLIKSSYTINLQSHHTTQIGTVLWSKMYRGSLIRLMHKTYSSSYGLDRRRRWTRRPRDVWKGTLSTAKNELIWYPL